WRTCAVGEIAEKQDESITQERETFLMDERMQAGMAEATRLTQAGQLAEATALIQRMLRGLPVDDGSEARRDRVKDVIETELWVVPDTPPAEGKEADFKEIQTEEKHGEQEYSSPATGGHK